MSTPAQTTTIQSDSPLSALVLALGAEDDRVRQRARQALIREGKAAVPYLIDALFSADEVVRLEAARALNESADPSAASALVIVLEDQASSVRWRAADALIALGRASLAPLLHALCERSDSVLLREGAHRIIYALVGRRVLTTILAPVLAALECAEPAVALPLAAQRAMDNLQAQAAGHWPAGINDMLVRDWMTANPYTINPQTTLPEARQLMRAHHIRRLPVVARGELVGIVTLGDLREAQPSDATSLSITEANALLAGLHMDQIMTRNVVTLLPDETLYDSAQRMLEHKISGLPVVEHGHVVGIITESDIFRAVVKTEDRHRSPAAA
jgi:CBS domain-containing protein